MIELQAPHSHHMCCSPAFLQPHSKQSPSMFVDLLFALCGYHTPSVMMVCNVPAFIGCFCAKELYNFLAVYSSTPVSTPVYFGLLFAAFSHANWLALLMPSLTKLGHSLIYLVILLWSAVLVDVLSIHPKYSISFRK